MKRIGLMFPFPFKTLLGLVVVGGFALAGTETRGRFGGAPGGTGTDLTLTGTATALKFVSTQVSGADSYTMLAGSRIVFDSDQSSSIRLYKSGSGLLTMTGDLVPEVTNTQDMGGSSKLWRTVYSAASTTTGVTTVGTSLVLSSYTDDSANPGNRTVNKVRGKNAVAIGATTAVVTNSFVTTASQVVVTLESVDATALYLRTVVPSGTGFTVTLGPANATAAVVFSWVVIN